MAHRDLEYLKKKADNGTINGRREMDELIVSLYLAGETYTPDVAQWQSGLAIDLLCYAMKLFAREPKYKDTFKIPKVLENKVIKAYPEMVFLVIGD